MHFRPLFSCVVEYYHLNGTDTGKMEKIRKRIVFHGGVQGVGFRWRAMNAAAMAGVSGWVRNEYDGSVTMEIQGSEEQIAQVISFIEQGRYVRISSRKEKEIPCDPDEHGFFAD